MSTGPHDAKWLLYLPSTTPVSPTSGSQEYCLEICILPIFTSQVYRLRANPTYMKTAGDCDISASGVTRGVAE